MLRELNVAGQGVDFLDLRSSNLSGMKARGASSSRTAENLPDRISRYGAFSKPSGQKR